MGEFESFITRITKAKVEEKMFFHLLEAWEIEKKHFFPRTSKKMLFSVMSYQFLN